MAVEHPAKKVGSARRSRAVTMALITGVCALAVTVLLNVLGERFPLRFDVTATGQQHLAPRTLRLLETLKGPHRLVIAVDLRTVDARARTNLQDVLDAMQATSDAFHADIIDTASAGGPDQFARVVAQLADRERPQIDAQAASVRAGVGAAEEVATSLSAELSPSLLTARDQVDASSPAGASVRAYLDQAAASARLLARDLSDAASGSPALLDRRIARTPVPATDRAANALARALDACHADLSDQARELRVLSESQDSSDRVRQALRALLPRVEAQRDRAALESGRLKELPRPDLLRAADVLERGAAALLVAEGGAGLVAMDLEWLLPSGVWLDAADAAKSDLRGRVEDLLAASLASLTQPNRPIVVLTHGESRAIMDKAPINDLWQRLALRGVEVREWPVGGKQTREAAVGPTGDRPVVYVVLAPESSAAAGADGNTGAQKATRLGEAVAELIGAGQGVLLSLNPSILSAFGEKDPIAASLQVLGVKASTATPLLSEVVTPQGRLIETDRMVQGGESDHPIAGAIRGLPTYLTWPIPMAAQPAGDAVSVWPLLSVAPQGDTWTETEWLRLRQTPREQRHLIPDPPKFDAGRDQRAPAEGLWVVAVAAEQAGTPRRRVVVVGSNDWFIDPVTQRSVQADGRLVAQNPGNLELFEASISWLAGQDDLIAQSPAARVVAMVRPIPQRSLRNLRLALSLGPPGLVLLAGLLYRTLRR